MVQKATEMGVGTLQPVTTRRTQVGRVNLERMRANAIEAAEQCGILSVPEIRPPQDFAKALASLEAERLLVFCDEEAAAAPPVQALATRLEQEGNKRLKLGVVVGPEGGFSDDERSLALRRPGMVRLSLGPRILRADTAAVAALALVQATLGDWR
jgi:16S rRNA (uracil1498-N3)-methyltransferase